MPGKFEMDLNMFNMKQCIYQYDCLNIQGAVATKTGTYTIYMTYSLSQYSIKLGIFCFKSGTILQPCLPTLPFYFENQLNLAARKLMYRMSRKKRKAFTSHPLVKTSQIGFSQLLYCRTKMKYVIQI